MQRIAVARELDHGLDVLEVHEVGAVRFEEAAPAQAALQFLQREVRDRLFAVGAQVGFAVAAGGIKDVARIIKQDAVLFARGYFEGRETFGRGRFLITGTLKRVGVCDTAIFQFYHARAALACPIEVFVGQQDGGSAGGGLFDQAGEQFLRVQVGARSWLVKQPEAMLPHQQPREGQAALRGRRELAHGLLGLLFGSIFQTATAAGEISGIVSFIYFLPVLFVGQLGQLLGNGPFVQIVKVLPTYYMADGISNAMMSQGTFADALLDISVTLGSAIVLLAIATWALRRQAAVVATI